MNGAVEIGKPPWTRSEIAASLDEFARIYARRPIQDNQGGMKAPHMFATWFMVRKLSPDLIVESGVWKGQGTWMLETACPGARLVSIDLNLGYRRYISRKAVYSDKDFSEHDWSEATDRSLAFFDDHQNACERLQQCKWFGFKNVIFEDNYPPQHGDCYSLKKAFAHAGFHPRTTLRRLAGLAHRAPGIMAPRQRVAPNAVDARMLQKNIEVYSEFPPVFRTPNTRWGDEWLDSSYPTPEPVLDRPTQPSHGVFLDEALWYTWICYVRLK